MALAWFRARRYAAAGVSECYRIGIDENGLGARLGPLVVTGVMARVSDVASARFERRLPRKLRKDLDDSKRLVRHNDVALAEAWARAVTGSSCSRPSEIVTRLSLDSEADLLAPCPKRAAMQCWASGSDRFTADDAMVARVRRHLGALERRGIEVVAVRCSIVCAKRLNQAKAHGGNRFVSDLHAMERIALELRRLAGRDVTATCGKVGSMRGYPRFFGPLAGWLHVALEENREQSAYRFPGLGELRFKKDADARDPLVMLASLVGKYLRELLMGRIAAFYGARAATPAPSGYHDPITGAFVRRTRLARRRRGVPDGCFERQPEGVLDSEFGPGVRPG
jgi:ribonuclease HII